MWVNLDVTIRPGQRPDCCASGDALPMPDATFNILVLHHVLEHFGCGEATGLIREAYRVLGERGKLYVFVPDLRALAVRWITGRLETQLYLTNLYGAYQGFDTDRHKWGYDGPYLSDWLGDVCQWNAVRVLKEPPVVEGAVIAWDWWILGVECVK